MVASTVAPHMSMNTEKEGENMLALSVFLPWLAIGLAVSLLLLLVSAIYRIALRVGDITRKRKAWAGTKRYYVY